MRLKDGEVFYQPTTTPSLVHNHGEQTERPKQIGKRRVREAKRQNPTVEFPPTLPGSGH